MLHTCGCSSWSYEEYIKAGLKAVDTLQPEAKDMSPEYLKKTFGGRLVFHGCVSTAGALTYGSLKDVEEDIKYTMEVMKPGGGYCMAPTHRIQDNTPLENVLCMYEKAKEFGRY
jgi:uroporphyrinogen decarboxylase